MFRVRLGNFNMGLSSKICVFIIVSGTNISPSFSGVLSVISEYLGIGILSEFYGTPVMFLSGYFITFAVCNGTHYKVLKLSNLVAVSF